MNGGGTETGGDTGGGGSGGSTGAVITGTGAASNTGPGDVSSYFPMATGNNWLFDASETVSGATSEGSLTRTVAGIFNVHGVNATAFQTTGTASIVTPQTDYYTSTGGGLTYYGNNDLNDPITSALVPAKVLAFPVQNGTVSDINATGLPAGVADNGDPIVFNVKQTTAVVNIGTVAVAAGSFANAVRVDQTVTGSAVETKTNQVLPIQGTETTWFAPGVGVVRDSQSSSIAGAPLATQDLSLRSYTVNGVFHGIGTPFPLFASAASWGNSAPTVNGGKSATDGNVVANVLLDGSWMLQISSPTGAVITTEVFADPVKGVFFDGTNFQVLTLHGSGYYAQRFSPHGTRIDSAPGNLVTPLVAGCGEDWPSFASGTDRTLAVMVCSHPLTSRGQIYGMVIPHDGSASTSGLFVIHTHGTSEGEDSAPMAASDGANYLVTWVLTPATGPRQQIVAAPVSTFGSVSGAFPIVVSDAGCQQSPDVAFDGVNYMVVWLDARFLACGQPGGQIYGMRVSTRGELLDGLSSTGGFAISSNDTGSGLPWGAVIGFNGSDYLVAWSDLSGSPGVAPRGVLAERVSASGRVLTTAPFALSGKPVSNGASTQPFMLTSRAFSTHNAYISWIGQFDSTPNTEVVISAP